MFLSLIKNSVSHLILYFNVYRIQQDLDSNILRHFKISFKQIFLNLYSHNRGCMLFHTNTSLIAETKTGNRKNIVTNSIQI